MRRLNMMKFSPYATIHEITSQCTIKILLSSEMFDGWKRMASNLSKFPINQLNVKPTISLSKYCSSNFHE